MSRHDLSRRRVLVTGGAIAVAGGLPIAASASTSHADAATGPDDGELLELIERFWAKNDEHDRQAERTHRLRGRLEADPRCPPLHYDEIEAQLLDEGWEREAPGFKAELRRRQDARQAFLRDHGWESAWEHTTALNEVRGELANHVFATPARTPNGVAAKLQILDRAIGNGADAAHGDPDLEAWQGDYERQHGRSWLASVIADLDAVSAKSTASAPAMAVPQADARTHGPNDRRLLALKAEYDRLIAEGRRLDRASGEAMERGDRAEVDRLEARRVEVDSRAFAMEPEIMAVQPRTWKGWAVQQRVYENMVRDIEGVGAQPTRVRELFEGLAGMRSG